MWLHIYYQFSIISLPKLFLIAGWKVAEGKGFNRSKLFCQWKSIQHLPTLTHRKNYLLEALSFGYIPFYFSHHPVTEFAHLYKNISKKNFFDVKCIIHLNIQSYTIYTFYGPFFQEECDQLLPAVLFLFSEYHFLCKQFIFQPNFEMLVLKTTFEIYW